MLAKLKAAREASANNAAEALPPKADPERLLPLKEVIEMENKLKELVSARPDTGVRHPFVLSHHALTAERNAVERRCCCGWD